MPAILFGYRRYPVFQAEEYDAVCIHGEKGSLRVKRVKAFSHQHEYGKLKVSGNRISGMIATRRCANHDEWSAPVKAACILVSFAIIFLSGCSTPSSQYVKAHPELPSAHRKILITGEIPGGNAVEGMTKEQIRLAVGKSHFDRESKWPRDLGLSSREVAGN